LDVTRRVERWIAAAVTGIVAGAALAASVSAHVHVDVEGGAIAGKPAQLVFEVENERADAATVSIEIQMPREADLTDVAPAEVDGWAVTVTTRDGDIVDTVRWDATGAGLVGEESAALPVAVGPLPAVESLTFPTVQTYEDGEVVRWIEPAPAGEPEPDLPAPTLAITAAAPADTEAPVAPPATDAPAPTEPAATAAIEPTTPSTEILVIATADTASDTSDAATAEATASPTTVETDDGDGAAVWPWVVVVIAIVVVGGGIAIAIVRRRPSG
jgi:uncharacterized protein YcnI